MPCVGCDNKGWVDSMYKGPSLCPLCKGSPNSNANTTGSANLVKSNNLSQVALWRQISEEPRRSFDQMMKEAKVSDAKAPIVVCVLFDVDITPTGNIFYEQIASNGQAEEIDRDALLARGYVLDEDKDGIVLVNEIPVGRIYHVFKDISDSNPNIEIEVDYNRKGNPLFTDDCMLAFRLVTCPTMSVYSFVRLFFTLCRKHNISEIVNLKLI